MQWFTRNNKSYNMFKYYSLLRLVARMDTMLFNEVETGNEALVERNDHI